MLIHNVRQKRKENALRYETFGKVLLFTYPVFIVLLSEFNHLQSLPDLMSFLINDFSVFLFDILLMGAIFAAILFFVRSGFWAMFSTGLVLFILSFVEYFKYKSSGAHFVLSDLFMAGNTSQLMKFAGVQLNAVMIVNILIFLAYFAVVFWFNPRLVNPMKNYKRFLTAISCLLIVAVSVATPLSTLIYSVFAVDNEVTPNNYASNEKFSRNNLVGYLAQTSTEQILNSIDEPEQYSEQSIQSELSPARQATTSVKPNVVVIMSESYADMRRLGLAENFDSYYTNFDRIAQEGFRGNAVVPTFGNTTVRTEFELMFGVPMKSLNDPTTPQKTLVEREQQPTFAQYYKENGYSTAYIHPFLSTFYGRDEIYSNYGFDKMLFRDDLTVEATQFREYIDDRTDFNQVLQELEDSDGPSYIYTSTMQNHQPYNLDENLTEFQYYMEGIKQTDQSLGEFFDALKQLEEPTVVLFVGDHYPYFADGDGVYEQAGINQANAYKLYQQPYLIWNNYGAGYSVPQEDVSAFYLPHLLVELTGAEQTPFIATFLDQMKVTPVYSSNYNREIAGNKALDELTYDRVLGSVFSELDKE